MTPAEWGKPIDVDEKWIHFVDDNVKASKFTFAIPTSALLTEFSIPARHCG